MQKVVVITGAASGIGFALARDALSRGLTVYATDRQAGDLAGLAERGATTLKLDVTSADDIAALVQRLAADGVEPDLLINNAGFGAMGPLAELPMARLRAQFEVNVFGLVALSQALVPGMVQRGRGCIVNIGSVSGIVATPFAGAYCASKAAVHALSDSLRMELAPFGIHVAIVQPGAIRSDFGASASKGVSQNTASGSLYSAIADAIDARAHAGQRGAISAEEFASRMLDEVLVRRPAPVIRIGPQTRLLPLAKTWVPTRALDTVLGFKFKLAKLGK